MGLWLLIQRNKKNTCTIKISPNVLYLLKTVIGWQTYFLSIVCESYEIANVSDE